MSHGIPRVVSRIQETLIKFHRIPAALCSSRASASNNKPEKMEELQANPFFSKYVSKITELQRANPSEFTKRLEENKSAKQAVQEKEKVKDGLAPTSSSAVPEARPPLTQRARLSDLLKVDLLADKTVEEISEVWRAFHLNQPGTVCAAMPTSSYRATLARAATHPLFLYPLPRATGYEFFVSQFQGSECHLTPLATYQQLKAAAPPCLSVAHFEDFADKGVVLMRGQFDPSVLNAVQVQCLLNQLQLYYATTDPHKLHLLEQFNTHPDTFDYQDLISEVEHSFVGLKSPT